MVDLYDVLGIDVGELVQLRYRPAPAQPGDGALRWPVTEHAGSPTDIGIAGEHVLALVRLVDMLHHHLPGLDDGHPSHHQLDSTHVRDDVGVAASPCPDERDDPVVAGEDLGNPGVDSAAGS